ncbi:hypothetical protein K438DRAFT_2063075 [Mycena galopus ATCC 62051]|nr:hypothetical protein K438DRAFT_2063075 [Mycena galopus ATCC 62051]
MLRAARTLSRRPTFPTVHVLRRPLESKALDRVTDQFQAIIGSHERLLISQKEAFYAQVGALYAQIDALYDRLMKAQIALNQAVLENTRLTEDLRIKLQKSRNNFHMRSAVSEIIASSLTERQKALNHSNPVRGAGVQAVIDAVAAGGFDEAKVSFLDPVTFHAAQNAVVGALTGTAKSGIKVNDVTRALASLYEELSEHHQSGVSKTLDLHADGQTLAHAIAAMSVILFARRLYVSHFDATYRDANGRIHALTTL